jgi:molybdopterin-guanine dinucleotide biosynthesis protein A
MQPQAVTPRTLEHDVGNRAADVHHAGIAMAEQEVRAQSESTLDPERERLSVFVQHCDHEVVIFEELRELANRRGTP